jgi:excisionase family DNA binding protein
VIDLQGETWATPDEIAEALGVSRRIVYDWTRGRSPRVRKVRVGRSVYVPEAEAIAAEAATRGLGRPRGT